MNFKFDDDKPIYKQLVDQFKTFIVTGTFKPGEKIPSVRDLAVLTKVNPNTIQRALMQLEDEGLIYTKRTSGKFITEDVKKLKTSKNENAEEIIKKFLEEMKKLNISKEEIIEYIRKED